MEQKILDMIQRNRENIIDFGRSIWNYPEPGYQERETAWKMQHVLRELGIETETGLALTGVKGYLKGKESQGNTVALVGQMDAIAMADGPYTCPETGCCHSWGHNGGLAGLMGAAIALSDPEIKREISGNVVWIAAPAGSADNLTYRHTLMEQGKIRYCGGIPELIRAGAFDGVDAVISHRIQPGMAAGVISRDYPGCLHKIVNLTAEDAEGDVFGAAHVAMEALHSQRRMLGDGVRIRSRMPEHADGLCRIPDHVTLEYSLVAETIPVLLDAEQKFDRCMRSGALAAGCGCSVSTLSGALPAAVSEPWPLLKDAVCLGAEDYPIELQTRKDPSGLGDLGLLLPTAEFFTGGYDWTLGEKRMHPVDEELAYVVPAKIFALAAWKMLRYNGKEVRNLQNEFRQMLTKKQYLACMDGRNRQETYRSTDLALSGVEC